MKRSSAYVLILTFMVMLAGCATVTQLGGATKSGDINQVKALLDAGANVNEEGIFGVTPLYEAVLYNAPTDIVKLLLERGADVNKGMSNGWRPIHLAADNGNIEVVRLLLDRGANISVVNPYGKTPLKIAEEKGHAIIARMLKDAEEKQYKKYIEVKTTPQFIEPLSILKSDVDELPAIKAKPNKNSYAIVIGIEQYRQKLPKADYAVADAQTMTEYLTKVMGYPEENVVTLLNDRASMSDITKYFEKWLSNNVEKDGSVFIYYSGHGAPNPKTGDAYLVPFDGDPAFIDQTGCSLKRLYARKVYNNEQSPQLIAPMEKKMLSIERLK